jgi:hypothetical protein
MCSNNDLGLWEVAQFLGRKSIQTDMGRLKLERNIKKTAQVVSPNTGSMVKYRANEKCLLLLEDLSLDGRRDLT